MPETETKTVGGGALPKHLFERDSRGAYETPTQTCTARSTAESTDATIRTRWLTFDRYRRCVRTEHSNHGSAINPGNTSLSGRLERSSCRKLDRQFLGGDANTFGNVDRSSASFAGRAPLGANVL